MKTYDFSKLGGFPLEQERMDWMQTGYVEAIKALAGLNPDTGTVWILTGCADQGTDADPGYIWYNGDIVRFAGGPKSLGSKVKISTVANDLEYEDSNVESVELETVASFDVAGALVYDDFKPWCIGFGEAGKTTRWALSGTNANYTYDGFYRKDLLANTLQLKLQIDVVDGTWYPAGGTGNPGMRSFEAVAILPTGYRPLNDTYLKMQMSDLTGVGIYAFRKGAYEGNPASPPVDYYAVTVIDLKVATTGHISFRALPLETNDPYSLFINCIIPLD